MVGENEMRKEVTPARHMRSTTDRVAVTEEDRVSEGRSANEAVCMYDWDQRYKLLSLGPEWTSATSSREPILGSSIRA